MSFVTEKDMLPIWGTIGTQTYEQALKVVPGSCTSMKRAAENLPRVFEFRRFGV